MAAHPDVSPNRLPARLTAPLLDKLREQFAPEASDADLIYWADVSRHLGLDPWAGHLALGRIQGVFRPLLTVAGRRWIAQRTGRLVGIVGPEWCGARQLDADGRKLPLEWLDVWDSEDDYPYAARCFVHVRDWEHPANGTVKWTEFARYYNGRPLDAWGRMPSHMLGKVAESLALRRAFSEVQAAVTYVGGDDAELVVEAEVTPVIEGNASTELTGGRSTPAAPSRPAKRAPAPAETVPIEVYDQAEQRGSR